MKTITIASGINIISNNGSRMADWKSSFVAREKMTTQAKSDICESIIATIKRDIMQFVDFEINEETSEIAGRLLVGLNDEQYLKHIRKDLKF